MDGLTDFSVVSTGTREPRSLPNDNGLGPRAPGIQLAVRKYSPQMGTKQGYAVDFLGVMEVHGGLPIPSLDYKKFQLHQT